jgi:hypothetical protein
MKQFLTTILILVTLIGCGKSSTSNGNSNSKPPADLSDTMVIPLETTKNLLVGTWVFETDATILTIDQSKIIQPTSCLLPKSKKEIALKFSYTYSLLNKNILLLGAHSDLSSGDFEYAPSEFESCSIEGNKDVMQLQFGFVNKDRLKFVNDGEAFFYDRKR